MLKFVACGAKLYARTPGGEIAFGNHGGLCEWRSGKLIIYTGSDRQAAVDGEVLHTSGHGEPNALGIQEGVRRHYELTN